MNPGEEKRFDGLLRNKFKDFEAAPNAAVWPAVSQTLPPAKTGLMQRALPFGLGTAFGILVSVGFVTGYQQWSGISESGTSATQTVLTPANQPETALAPATAALSAKPANAATSGNGNATAGGPATSGQENALAMNSVESNSISGTNRQYNRTTYSQRHIETTEYRHNRYTTSEEARIAAVPASSRIRQREAAAVARRTTSTGSQDQVAAQPVAETGNTTPANTATTEAATPKATATTATIIAPSAWLTGHDLDTAIAKVLTVDPKLTGNKTELKELLKAQGTVLAVLQNRNDSLLLALKDSELDSTIAKVRINRPRRHVSSIKPPVGWPSPSNWAITASYEANPQWGGIAMSHTNASRWVLPGINLKLFFNARQYLYLDMRLVSNGA